VKIIPLSPAQQAEVRVLQDQFKKAQQAQQAHVNFLQSTSGASANDFGRADRAQAHKAGRVGRREAYRRRVDLQEAVGCCAGVWGRARVVRYQASANLRSQVRQMSYDQSFERDQSGDW
jgi:hypothetical protein